MNDFEILNSRYHDDWVKLAAATTDPATKGAAQQAADLIKAGFAYLDAFPPGLRQTLEQLTEEHPPAPRRKRGGPRPYFQWPLHDESGDA